MGSRSKGRLVLGLASLVLALLLGEILVRVYARSNGAVLSLAQGGVPVRESYHSLEDFLQARSLLRPHQDYLNYWTNSLGFNDREFEVPKPAGRFRILALGDSFCLGFVPYPEAALTLLEEKLSQEQDLDLLNMGINATGVWEYRQLFELGGTQLEPDLVVVHFYMGNDGPDLLQGWNDIPKLNPGHKTPLWSWNLLANSLLAYRSLKTVPPPPTSSSSEVVAGTQVDPKASPESPRFSEQAFEQISRPELTRLYKIPQSTEEQYWAPILEQLSRLHDLVERSGAQMVLVLYPSRWQVYPQAREALIGKLKERAPYAHFQEEMFDPDLPQTTLSNFCSKRQIPCLDLTPSLREFATNNPQQPLYRDLDSHWNRLGNQQAAQAEATLLKPLIR